MTLLASARVEALRLTRTGLLFALAAVFAFFGLAGPVLAVHMPELMRSAAGTEQLTILAAEATAADGIALFNQSAMQLGLIVAVAVAVTALGWDARPGSSIFYRTRVRRLGWLTTPRLIVGLAVVVTCYLAALGVATVMTTIVIAPPDLSSVATVGVASSVYLVLAMSIGHLIMAVTRRTAPALAIGTVLMLLLPLLNSVTATAAWSPTALANATAMTPAELVWPFVSAAVAIAICVVVADLVAKRHGVRRDA